MKLPLTFLVLGLASLPLSAEPVRVTAWDLQPAAEPGVTSLPLASAAAKTLKKLHPDVILLQHAADWETCQQICDGLQPDSYRVVTCSSWNDPRAVGSSHQAAILAKSPASISWSEPWPAAAGAPGGYCFASIRLDGKNVGILSAQLGDGDAESKGQQLSQKIASLDHWKNNRPQAFILAGDFTTPPRSWQLQEPDFQGAEALMTRGIGVVSPPKMTPAPHFEHPAVTYEMELATPQPVLAAAPAARAPLPAAKPVVAVATARNPHLLWWLAGTLLAGAAGLLAASRFIGRSSRKLVSPQWPGAKTNTGTTIANLHTGQVYVVPRPDEPAPVTEAVRAGVVAELSQWFKQTIVRRLLSDRAELLANQEAAKLKVLAVDERLTKIERQIKERNEDYERRIDVLLKALVTAEEENRELIRAQIELLKAEMEKARRRDQAREREEY